MAEANNSIDGGGLRYNNGKKRYDLIQPDALAGLVDVLTYGSTKYAERNWERGMKWSNVIASLKRHLAAIEQGIDYDEETSMLHADHLQCNAHFLSAYYKIYPQGDDRLNTYFNKRVALDIDGVLADYATAFCDYAGIEYTNKNWLFSYKWRDLHKELYTNKEFWLNLKPLISNTDLTFDPVAYVTNRHIPVEWCEEWLEKNGFPCADVHVVTESKVDILKSLKVDIFVDDWYENFVDLNNAGIFTYLYDRPYNQKYKCGHRRIYKLSDITNK